MSNARNLARLLPNTSGQLPDAAMSSGSVLQVVQATYNTQGSTTSGTPVSVNLSASITPTSATSKILVVVVLPVQGAPNVNNRVYLYRNGSSLFFAGYTNAQSQNVNQNATISYLDSPATTSATTYAPYIAVTSGGTMSVNVGSSLSTITLMEIAA